MFGSATAWPMALFNISSSILPRYCLWRAPVKYVINPAGCNYTLQCLYLWFFILQLNGIALVILIHNFIYLCSQYCRGIAVKFGMFGNPAKISSGWLQLSISLSSCYLGYFDSVFRLLLLSYSCSSSCLVTQLVLPRYCWSIWTLQKYPPGGSNSSVSNLTITNAPSGRLQLGDTLPWNYRWSFTLAFEQYYRRIAFFLFIN